MFVVYFVSLPRRHPFVCNAVCNQSICYLLLVGDLFFYSASILSLLVVVVVAFAAVIESMILHCVV